MQVRNSKPDKGVGTVIDIDARKRAEEALRTGSRYLAIHCLVQLPLA
jgi:hypothetical protein